eukprot:TRINITY_DN753_c0_g3_i3.p1 TRINITY_DN753_c0_g3~~TRINITY_DN753_c0_g3_i3.p1  ORF type:complete len:971 (+),score=253.33 TRINITY_DN753_c0_g3_i3:55-2913(+)
MAVKRSHVLLCNLGTIVLVSSAAIIALGVLLIVFQGRQANAYTTSYDRYEDMMPIVTAVRLLQNQLKFITEWPYCTPTCDNRLANQTAELVAIENLLNITPFSFLLLPTNTLYDATTAMTRFNTFKSNLRAANAALQRFIAKTETLLNTQVAVRTASSSGLPLGDSIASAVTDLAYFNRMEAILQLHVLQENLIYGHVTVGMIFNGTTLDTLVTYRTVSEIAQAGLAGTWFKKFATVQQQAAFNTAAGSTQCVTMGRVRDRAILNVAQSVTPTQWYAMTEACYTRIAEVITNTTEDTTATFLAERAAVVHNLIVLIVLVSLAVVFEVIMAIVFSGKVRSIAAEALESAKTKAEFLATMSHEIRTPLNGVLGTTQLIKNCTSMAEVQKLCDTVQYSGEVLMSLINDVLHFIRADANKLTLDQEDFDLQQLCETVVVAMYPSAVKKGLQFNLCIEDSAPRQVVGDSMRIRQILVNLLTNAIKFTASGSVTLTMRLVHSDGATVTMELSVADTGIGISPETQRHLFQPFTQADSSITRQYGGTGLGLAICKRLARLMGGDIWVQSQLGNGSTFSARIKLVLVPDLLIKASKGELEMKQTPAAIIVVTPQVENVRHLFWKVGREVVYVHPDQPASLQHALEAAPDARLVLDCSLTDSALKTTQTAARPDRVSMCCFVQCEQHLPSAATCTTTAAALGGLDNVTTLCAPALRKDIVDWLDNPVTASGTPINTGSRLQQRQGGGAVTQQDGYAEMLSRRGSSDSLATPTTPSLISVVPTTEAVIEQAVRRLQAEQRNLHERKTNATPSQQAPLHPGSPQAAEALPPHVLVVEDNEVNQRVCTLMLQRLNCTFEVVGDGLQAVNLIKERHSAFDMVLMDLQMPIMSGFDSAMEIRKFELQSSCARPLYIVAVTANVLSEEMDRCKAVGMNAYMTKPIVLQEMAKHVDICIQRRSSVALA